MSKKAPKQKKEQTSVSTEVADRPTGFDPFQRLGLSEWMDRWPEMFSRRWPESFAGLPFVEGGFRMEQLVEDDGTVVVRGELPGLDPDEDVTITVEGGRLTISGRREESSEDRSSGAYRSEFHYGSFHRSTPLPAGALADEVTATYSGGILEVRVPVDQREVKKVSIETTD